MSNKSAETIILTREEASGPPSGRSANGAGSATTTILEAPDQGEEERSLQKPDWPLGLPLQPQHFEAQDAYHERRTTFVLDLLFEQPWGVADLALDANALRAGEIAVRRFEGIFPDGTPASLSDGPGNRPLARSFEGAFRGGRDGLGVYLGLLRQVPGQSMVGDDAGGTSERGRFSRRSTQWAELGTGQNPVALPWLRPNVRILFDGEPTEEYSVLRIARLVRTGAGIALDPKFVPPALRIGASPVLDEVLRSVEQRLVDTRTALLSQRRDGQESTRADATRAVLVMMIGRLIPDVTEVLRPNVHPREAYGVLAELLGALSPLASRNPPAVPRFDSLDLGTTFDALAGHIHSILGALMAARYRAIPLVRHDASTRIAELREPALFNKSFVLAVRSTDPARTRSEVPLIAKVAAPERLAALINAAVPGVQLVAEPHRPPGLDVSPQAVCFRVETTGEEWQEVMRRGSLAICLPAPYQNDVSLFVREGGLLD